MTAATEKQGNDNTIMEYREVLPERQFGLTVSVDQLNNLAAEGWRVVAVSYDQSHDIRRVLMERPKS
jgi:hypothetical protein